MNDRQFPERLTRAEIELRQLHRLCALVDAVAEANPFWKRKFAAAAVDPESIVSLEDLTRLPFCTKQELVEDQLAHLPYGSNLSYPLKEYSRLHQTSGTTGRPMIWMDTPASWNWLMGCWAQIYRIIQLGPEDVMAFPFSFGPFIGFWAAFDSGCRSGRRCIPMGGMTSEARLRMILDLQANIICCTPTYALRLVETAATLGVDLQKSAVHSILVAGEPGGAVPSIRRRIEQGWGARVFDHWGMTDIGSLGIEPFDAPGGLTILETECIAEVVRPDSGEPVKPGEPGELVITNLGRVGQPVIRYRTGDLVRVSPDPCPSGMHLMRLEGGILGRVDDMVTIRGNNVFPSAIGAILREFDDVVEYRIILQTRRSMPHLKIEVEACASLKPDSVEKLVEQLRRQIKDRLQFHAEILPVATGALPRFEMKGRRFVRES